MMEAISIADCIGDCITTPYVLYSTEYGVSISYETPMHSHSVHLPFASPGVPDWADSPRSAPGLPRKSFFERE